MKPKRYFASDMSAAIKLVREDLGPEAIILSNKKVSGGVEIVSVLDNIGEILNRETNTAEATVKSKANLRSFQANHRPSTSKETGSQALKGLSGNDVISEYGIESVSKEPIRREGKERQTQSLDKERDIKKNTNRVKALRSKPGQSLSSAGTGAPSATPSSSFSSASAASSKSAFDYYHEVAAKDSLAEAKTAGAETPDSGIGLDEISEMRGELIFLRNLIEKQGHSSRGEVGPVHRSAISHLNHQLVSLGFSPQIIEKAIADSHMLKGQGLFGKSGKVDDLKTVLERLIKEVCLANYDVVETGGCVLLLGPPGAGKTTTLAKIATRRVLEWGPKSVRIISLDSNRIGAGQQIKAIAELLNVTVEIQYDADFLLHLDSRYSESNVLTLIDTAGMLPQDEYWLKQKNSLKNLPKFVKKLLVLPCSSQLSTLQSMINNFSDIGISGCILTKLDETSSMGESLSAMIQSGLEINYIANGQQIPFDLFQFDHEGLLNILEDQVVHAEDGGELRNGSYS